MLVQQTLLYEFHLVVGLIKEVDRLVPVLAQGLEKAHGNDTVVQESQVALRVRDIVLLDISLG